VTIYIQTTGHWVYSPNTLNSTNCDCEKQRPRTA